MLPFGGFLTSQDTIQNLSAKGSIPLKHPKISTKKKSRKNPSLLVGSKCSLFDKVTCIVLFIASLIWIWHKQFSVLGRLPLKWIHVHLELQTTSFLNHNHFPLVKICFIIQVKQPFIYLSIPDPSRYGVFTYICFNRVVEAGPVSSSWFQTLVKHQSLDPKMFRGQICHIYGKQKYQEILNIFGNRYIWFNSMGRLLRRCFLGSILW